jgi:hypothetical protein
MNRMAPILAVGAFLGSAKAAGQDATQPPERPIPEPVRALAAPVTNTEAEAILHAVKAPARFADYTPRFTLRRREFMDQSVPARSYEILDGGWLVARYESSWTGGVDPLCGYSLMGRPGDRF